MIFDLTVGLASASPTLDRSTVCSQGPLESLKNWSIRYFCLILVALPLSAGIRIRMEVTDLSNNTTTRQEVLLDAARLRFEMDASQSVVFLTDNGGSRVVLLDKNKNEYTEMDQQTFNQITQQAQAMLADACTRPLCKIRAPQAIVYTSKGAGTVSGFSCTQFEGVYEGRKVSEVCAAQPVDLKFSPNDFQVFEKMKDFMASFGTAIENIYSVFADKGINGFPVQTIYYWDGQARQKTEIKSLEPAAFSDADFSLGSAKKVEVQFGPAPLKPDLAASQAPAKTPSAATPAGTTKVNPQDGLTYAWIPPGTFTMGCSLGDNECFNWEKPAHSVTLTKGFWIGQTEVTQEAYQRVIGNNPSYLKGANLPVESISWNDAQAFCRAAGMRLPTEAEWEYAARGASPSARYGDIDSVAWYGSNSGPRAHDVKQKQPNGHGLYDVLGNVFEWVADWYGPYAGTSQENPVGATSGPHLMRGGMFGEDARGLRVSARGSSATGAGSVDTGVRCAGD